MPKIRLKNDWNFAAAVSDDGKAALTVYVEVDWIVFTGTMVTSSLFVEERSTGIESARSKVSGYEGAAFSTICFGVLLIDFS